MGGLSAWQTCISLWYHSSHGKGAHCLYLPEILEEQTRGRMRRLYHSIEMTLHVPFVSDVFRVLAHYPGFLHLAFETSRPNLLSLHFEKAADELRSMPVPDPPPPSLPSYVTRFDMRGAASILPVFHYLNAKLLLLVSAWYEALSDRPIVGHQGAEDLFVPPGIQTYFPPQMPLLPLERTPKPMRQLLKQIADEHHSFGPTSDYRALALYPTFLTGAWQGLQPYVNSAWYRESSHLLQLRAQKLASQLPHPMSLSPRRLQQVIPPREVAACIGIVATFRQCLPGLIIDIELMSQMLKKTRGNQVGS